jgi:hypothetical protein
MTLGECVTPAPVFRWAVCAPVADQAGVGARNVTFVTAGVVGGTKSRLRRYIERA